MNENDFVDLLEEFDSSDRYSFSEEEAKEIVKELDDDIASEINDNNYRLAQSIDSAFNDMTPIRTHFL